MKTQSFFRIHIKYKIKEEIPLELLTSLYQEQLKIIEKVADVHFDLIQIERNHAKLFCTLNTPLKRNPGVEEKMKLAIQGMILEVSVKTFSLFEPKIKTPIVLQWERL